MSNSFQTDGRFSGTYASTADTESSHSGNSQGSSSSCDPEVEQSWKEYMSLNLDSDVRGRDQAYRRLTRLSLRAAHKRGNEISPTPGPFALFVGPNYLFEARKIYHAYGEGSKAMFEDSGAMWEHMSAQLSEHAESFNSDSLEGFRKVPLTHAILSLADHVPAPKAPCKDFPSETYRELLGLFTPDKVHRGDPEEKEVR
jgi:hypothetical protein